MYRVNSEFNLFEVRSRERIIGAQSGPIFGPKNRSKKSSKKKRSMEYRFKIID